MPPKYRPSDHEGRIRARWEASGAFHADPGRVLGGEAEPYCIVIPPPNVTDRLHLGHALNNTLQDVLVRVHRMRGFETLWMPGTDHAGIATQAVVERRLREQGRLKGPLREAMKREEFVAIVQSFKDEYEATITGQLKAMGCSCDWARQRFTMDEQCTRAVYEAFFRLFRDGLIYRGKRLVNWDPVLQTAVADDETEDVEVDGNFYYLRYPLVHGERRKGGEDAVPVTWSELRRRGWPAAYDADHADEKQAWVTVATTRPETYLGDAAVGVNPRDPRAKALRGLAVELPLVGRIIPIVEDEYVVMPARSSDSEEATQHAARRSVVAERSAQHEPEDPKAKFATGFLKVTPAHDQNDYDLYQRHREAIDANSAGAGLVNVFAPDAKISDKHGWTDVGDARLFLGLPREDARKKVVMEFKARGLHERTVPYRHSVKHSDRSKAAIEPYLSDQWYVRVTDDRMKGAALRALAAATSAQQHRSTTTRQQSSNLAKPERDAGDGDLQFYPERYTKTYQAWHEGIRDWCISRQLWWGHRIPVWTTSSPYRPGDSYGGAGYVDRFAELAKKDPKIAFARTEAVRDTHGYISSFHAHVCLREQDPATIKLLEQSGFVRDPDVLDTWFSSALWPTSTMGWPNDTELLRAFNPTDVLCTAREIITLWVSRMVMFERYLMPEGWARSTQHAARSTPGPRTQDPGRRTLDDSGGGSGPLPFRDVFIHAMIQDGEGRKMSKSLGNGVDPLDIIQTHGADAMRFTLCQMTTHTQDVRMPVGRDPATGRNTSPKFDLGRNLCNKVWNAARLALSILEGRDEETKGRRDEEVGGRARADARSTQHAAQTLVDRWMLSRLAAATAEINEAIAGYEFSEYAQRVYDLLWRDFCDWYLEAIKPTAGESASQRAVLAHALEVILRLLHPIAPFVTEAIWERVRDLETDPIAGIELGPSRNDGLLCTAGWPRVSASLRDERAEHQFERLRTLITDVLRVRAAHQVPPKRKVTLHATREIETECRVAPEMVHALAGLERITTEAPSGPAVQFTLEGVRLHLSSMADEVDASAEKARLIKRIAELEKSIATLEARLANPGYSQKAPPAMVQQTREQLEKAKAERDAARATFDRLS